MELYFLRKLKNLIQKAQNIKYSENDNGLFETYKDFVMPHGRHIYATSADTDMATMCAYTLYQHAFAKL